VPIKRAAPWLVGALLFAFGIFRIALILPARSHQNDFAHYYVSSRLWLQGTDPYTAAFAPEFDKYGFRYDPRIPSATNPPPFVAAFAPIALLTPPAAFAAWVAVQSAALSLTLFMIASLLRHRIRSRMLPLLLGLLVASSTLYFHFYFSQVQLVLGAMMLCAYVLHRSGRYSSALVLATAAALLKLFPATMVPWFVLAAPGSWKQKLTRTLPAVVLVIVTLSGTWPLWAGFLHAGSGVVRDAIVNQTFNFSLPSLIVNVGIAQRSFTPSPAEIASIWRFASAAGLLLVGLAYVPLLSQELDPESSFCLLMLLCTVASPTAWGHYFVLGFFPFAVFCARMLERPAAVRLLAIALAYGVTLNLGDGVSLPASVAGRINAALPYAARVALSYVPLYGSIALAAWFRASRVAAPPRGTAVPVSRRAANHANRQDAAAVGA
jgi:hypothetical protein